MKILSIFLFLPSITVAELPRAPGMYPPEELNSAKTLTVPRNPYQMDGPEPPATYMFYYEKEEPKRPSTPTFEAGSAPGAHLPPASSSSASGQPVGPPTTKTDSLGGENGYDNESNPSKSADNEYSGAPKTPPHTTNTVVPSGTTGPATNPQGNNEIAVPATAKTMESDGYAGEDPEYLPSETNSGPAATNAGPARKTGGGGWQPGIDQPGFPSGQGADGNDGYEKNTPSKSSGSPDGPSEFDPLIGLGRSNKPNGKNTHGSNESGGKAVHNGGNFNNYRPSGSHTDRNQQKGSEHYFAKEMPELPQNVVLNGKYTGKKKPVGRFGNDVTPGNQPSWIYSGRQDNGKTSKNGGGTGSTGRECCACCPKGPGGLGKSSTGSGGRNGYDDYGNENNGVYGEHAQAVDREIVSEIVTLSPQPIGRGGAQSLPVEEFEVQEPQQRVSSSYLSQEIRDQQHQPGQSQYAAPPPQSLPTGPYSPVPISNQQPLLNPGQQLPVLSPGQQLPQLSPGYSYVQSPAYGPSQYPQYPQYPTSPGCGCQPPPTTCCQPITPCCLPQIPCCPPPPPLPCCPKISFCCQPPPPVCCQPVVQCCPAPPIPTCFRSCPSCPCRRRLHKLLRMKRSAAGSTSSCNRCTAAGQTMPGRVKRQSCGGGCKQNSQHPLLSFLGQSGGGSCGQCGASHRRVKRMGCLPCLNRSKREIEEDHHKRVKRMGCLPCLGKRKKRSAGNCHSCSNLGHVLQRFKRTICLPCGGRKKRDAAAQEPKNCPCAAAASTATATAPGQHTVSRKKRDADNTYDSIFTCDKSCCDYDKCNQLRAKRLDRP